MMASVPETMGALSTPRAVDVHGHYGPYSRGVSPVVDWCMSGEADEVAARASRASIGWTVVSPLKGLVPRFEADAVAGNEEATRLVPATPGLLQWVIIDPRRPETYAQAHRMLQDPWCVGVKIHPEEHGYPIAEYGGEIFDFCADHGAVVLTHSGEENSLPSDFLPFADAHPDLTLILGHLGFGFDGDPTHQVRAVQASRHGNVYTETSSARSIMSRLIEWAVSEVGADHVLFGSDTPLYAAATQHARIARSELTDRDRALILAGNANRLLRLDGLDPCSGW